MNKYIKQKPPKKKRMRPNKKLHLSLRRAPFLVVEVLGEKAAAILCN